MLLARSRRTVFASVYDVVHGTEDEMSIDIIDNHGYLTVPVAVDAAHVVSSARFDRSCGS